MSVSDTQYDEMGERISSWQHVAVLSHMRPDGDSLGSTMGLSRMLRGQGIQTLPYFFGPFPHRYDCMRPLEPLQEWLTDYSEKSIKQCDGIILVDTCAREQLLPVVELLESRERPVLAIDHHSTHDPLADHHLIDPSASSASLMVAELAKRLDWDIDQCAADALYIGIAMDTGWFRFSNTDARTLRMASELIHRGVESAQWYQTLHWSDSPARLRLMVRSLQSLELHFQEQLALCIITRNMFQETGAVQSDVEDLVNEPLRIASVEASILMVEQQEGTVKVSLRSKQNVDVAKLASTFGGGGHVRAAGARIPGTLPDVRTKLLDAFRGSFVS